MYYNCIGFFITILGIFPLILTSDIFSINELTDTENDGSV